MTHLRILNKFIGQNSDRNSLKRSVYNFMDKTIKYNVGHRTYYEEERFQFWAEIYNEISRKRETKNYLLLCCIV